MSVCHHRAHAHRVSRDTKKSVSTPLFRVPLEPTNLGKRKPGREARFLVRRRGGASVHLPEGNCCQRYGCHLGGWGNRFASQHGNTMRRTNHADNEVHYMPAMRKAGADNWLCTRARCRVAEALSAHARRNSRAFDARRQFGISERPALRVGDEKIAERLHACHGLEFFRIDEIGVERRRLRLTE